MVIQQLSPLKIIHRMVLGYALVPDALVMISIMTIRPLMIWHLVEVSVQLWFIITNFIDFANKSTRIISGALINLYEQLRIRTLIYELTFIPRNMVAINIIFVNLNT